jgi:hypothetical protein
MRDLVYTGFMSLDGVVDSPGGPGEGHRSGGWVVNDLEFVPEAWSLKGEELLDRGRRRAQGGRGRRDLHPWERGAGSAAVRRGPDRPVQPARLPRAARCREEPVRPGRPRQAHADAARIGDLLERDPEADLRRQALIQIEADRAAGTLAQLPDPGPDESSDQGLGIVARAGPHGVDPRRVRPARREPQSHGRRIRRSQKSLANRPGRPPLCRKTVTPSDGMPPAIRPAIARPV